jgi:hypothetical protein
MSEAESMALAISVVYSAYYSELGTAPELPANKPSTERNGVRLSNSPKPQPAAAARNFIRAYDPQIRTSLLDFWSTVAPSVVKDF